MPVATTPRFGSRAKARSVRLEPVSLSGAVPAVARWRVPKGLEPDQKRWMLASCDLRRTTGRRDVLVARRLAHRTDASPPRAVCGFRTRRGANLHNGP